MHKQAVIEEMRVKPQIDVESEVETRVNFIKSQLVA
jgi:NAD+ synthase